jgi:cob(I)alamin adenosyltransferase
MLYTRKGDAGTTKTFGCNDRVSKASAVAEALGALDEVNSFLGLVKVKSAQFTGPVVDVQDNSNTTSTNTANTMSAIIHQVQENLFIIQAEVAGFQKEFGAKKVTEIEQITDAIEKKLHPIKTFFISGGTELATMFDISRTMARRAERRVVAYNDSISGSSLPAPSPALPIRPDTLAYLNRLSSLLYAVARYSNFLAGISENPPSYK